MSAALFPILGVSPALGRTFTETEDVGQKPLAVVSHRYWQTRLGGDRSRDRPAAAGAGQAVHVWSA